MPAEALRNYQYHFCKDLWYNRNKRKTKGGERMNDYAPRHRVILHCDMNNCYASIEMKLNPELRGKAIAVCGSKEQRHGIVLAKSDLAKKKGVTTGEAIWQAQLKCPELIIVPPHFSEYRKYSEAAKAIYAEYTDYVEPFGLDECWLDVTGSRRLFGDGETIAHTIRNRIKNELGITVSIGVSFNKIFAKLGSDLKKPDAVTVIGAYEYPWIVGPLPVGDLLGVGKKTAEKLRSYCIYTIGDLAECKPEWLKRHFGKQGEWLWHAANGLDHTPVRHIDDRDPPKSIGRGTTLPKDLYNKAEVWPVLIALSDVVGKELHKSKFLAGGVQLTIRNSAFVDRQIQMPCRIATRNPKELAQYAMQMFERHYIFDLPVRALTVRAIQLQEENTPLQIRFDEDIAHRERRDKLEKAALALEDRFGAGVVHLARSGETASYKVKSEKLKVK